MPIVIQVDNDKVNKIETHSKISDMGENAVGSVCFAGADAVMFDGEPAATSNEGHPD